MQHLTLIKKGTSKLNHFYEHLYCIELGKELRKHGFYNYTDYRIEARSYHVGFIYITALFYNPKVIASVDLAQIVPILSSDAIGLAAMQISAENRTSIMYDEKALIADLKQLSAQPWEDLGHSGTHNLRHSKTSNYPHISMNPVAKSNFRNMTCKITLDQEYALKNENLLPLFREVSNALLYNLSDLFTDTYGYFGLGNKSMYDPSQTSESHTFCTHQKNALSAEKLLTIAREYVLNQLQSGFKQSMNAYLASFTDERNYFYNEADIFETTGVLVGKPGWETLRGHAPNEILKHCSITIKAGKHIREARVVQ